MHFLKKENQISKDSQNFLDTIRMNFKNKFFIGVLISLLVCSFQLKNTPAQTACKKVENRTIKTEYIVVLVIDGPRFSETFGDTSFTYIPNLAKELAPQGVLVKNFKNKGVTLTNSGHTAITTGTYQNVKNDGTELPKNTSLFHYYLSQVDPDVTKTWVIASKGKLDILASTSDRKWKDSIKPSVFCGIEGKGGGYAKDDKTFEAVLSIFTNHHPKLSLINLLEVDVKGHANDWEGYLQAIRNTDVYAKRLWDFIQADSMMQGKTTLFITNDHGRHKDGHKDGFISHGDMCSGCRDIYLVALGPDFKVNTVIDEKYEQLDISKTISYMFNFKMPTSKGKVMEALFLSPH
jgi:predicted AlkP superfamily pyrophosphatase or phosphodiesterase